MSASFPIISFLYFVWFCFVFLLGQKLSKVPPKKKSLRVFTDFFENRRFMPNYEFINEINSAQQSWKAGVYADYTRMTMAQMMFRAGGPKKFDFPQPRLVSLWLRNIKKKQGLRCSNANLICNF